MDTKSLKRPLALIWWQQVTNLIKAAEPLLLFTFLLLLWAFGPYWLNGVDGSAGNVNQGIWLLVILSMISFLMICALSWWLLQRFWLQLELPAIELMVSQFKKLELWQQLGFIWASFAALLFSAALCLNAIC